ncbi:MAG: TonB-dependent receptor, partial [bacterium]|nr:TonB-dependent receptor [bacterium]
MKIEQVSNPVRLLAFLATFGIWQTTFAQDGEERVLDEVTVTAQKREQSLQDVPIAVSALSGESMEDAGILNMEDISRQVPSLEVQSSSSAQTTNFRLRRVGNLGNIPTFEPAVGVFIDGAYRSRAVFGASDLFDIERIEVLRGPQSTLYGKNVTAGVLGIYTQAPADTFTGSLELTGGSIDSPDSANMYHAKGGLSGPLGDNVRGSLGFSYSSADPTMTQALAGGVGEDANDKNRYSIRGQLHWDITDALDARLIVGAVSQDDETYTADVFYDPNGFVPIILGVWQGAGVSTPCADNDAHNRIGCSRLANTEVFDSTEATLLLNYELANGWTFNSVTSWDWFKAELAQDDVVQLSAPVLRFHDTQESESFQQEMRFASAGGESVDWLAGVFYYSNEFKRGDDGKRPMFLSDTLSAHPAVGAVNNLLFGLPIPIAADGQIGIHASNQDTDYLGVFGQATFNISDRISVTAGVRWQEESKDAAILHSVNDPSPSVISLLLAPAAVSGTLSRDTDKVTWSLSPQYFVTDETMLFATIANGFKSGGFNTGFGGIPISSREFKDEDIMHYEAGLKTTLADGRAQLGASLFMTNYDDYQDAAFVGSQFTVGNAEEVELTGFELDGSVLIGESLTADFALSYADLEYKAHTSGQCYPGRAPDSPTNAAACDLSGEKPVNAPEWKTHLGIQYDNELSFGDFYARADWAWTDEYNTSFSADPRLLQDAYSWVNFRTGIRWSNFDVVLWANNLLDETVVNFDAVQNVYAGATDASYQSFLQPPRS